VGDDIAAGRLVPVLEQLNPGDSEDINAVYLGQSGPLPARVRAFIDFLVEHVRIGDPPLASPKGGGWRITKGTERKTQPGWPSLGSRRAGSFLTRLFQPTARAR